jgi:hypothetical protein
MLIRNLKTLGLVLVVALAVSAMAASPVHAEQFIFESEAEHTTLVGEQEGTSTMSVDAGTISCKAPISTAQ